MAVKLLNSIPVGPDMVNLGVDDATAQWPVGLSFVDIYGNKYMYVKFGYAATAGDAVTFSPAATTNNKAGAISVIQPTTATLAFFAGFAMNTVASGDYGFIQIYGWNQVALASTTTVIADYHKITNASSAISDTTTAISGNTITPAYTYFIVCDTAASSAVPAVNTVFFTSAISAAGV